MLPLFKGFLSFFYLMKKFSGIEKDNFVEKNFNIKNIINRALFSQLSEIKVFLFDFQKEMTQNLIKQIKRNFQKLIMLN